MAVGKAKAAKMKAGYKLTAQIGRSKDKHSQMY